MDIKIPLRKSLKRTLPIKDETAAKKLRISYDEAVPLFNNPEVPMELQDCYDGAVSQFNNPEVPMELQTVEQDLVDVETDSRFHKKAMDIDCEESHRFITSKIKEAGEIIAKSWDTVNTEQCKLNNRRERIMLGKMEICIPNNPAKPTTLPQCDERQLYLDQVRNRIREKEIKLKSIKKKASMLSFNLAGYRPIEINYDDNHESLCEHLDFFIGRVLP